ncbi:MAG: hypothetical protein IPI90_17715 [Saprospiraceae bacterium]|nr:hypothetical protein [Candidatus Vicinibacter affinis]
MSWIFGSQLHQLDSAELYAHKATAAAPSWVLPYVYMAENFLLLKKYEKAKQFLEIVDQIDSSSLHVWGAWATYYFNKKEFSEAERRLNKSVTILDVSFCLPCSQTLLTEIYFFFWQYDRGRSITKKLIEHDSPIIHII